MVTVLLEGGLGSQMFGYAAGRRLALAHGVDLMIDTRLYRTYTKFQPELHHFNVQAKFPTWEESERLCGPQNEHVRVVTPSHYHVDPAILEIDDPNVMMVGNAISEDYFFDIIDVIRQDFTRKTQPVQYAIDSAGFLEELMQRGYDPIAVHVRRGDKALDPTIKQVHGLATTEFYENAMMLMSRLVRNPWFVFFSDGTDWVRATLSRPNATIMEPPAGTPPVEDMMLMAKCRHHILGNSTYSWWGAWLSDPHADHVVIGPRPIMADRTQNTEDVMLRNWISLGATERVAPSRRVPQQRVSVARPASVEPFGGSASPSVLRVGAHHGKLRI
jgi:hypothetical protein